MSNHLVRCFTWRTTTRSKTSMCISLQKPHICLAMFQT